MKTPLQVGERVKHPHHKEIEVLRPTHTPIQDVQRTVLGLYIAETLLQGKGEVGKREGEGGGGRAVCYNVQTRSFRCRKMT